MGSYTFIEADAEFNPVEDGDPLWSNSLFIGSAEYEDGSYQAVLRMVLPSGRPVVHVIDWESFVGLVERIDDNVAVSRTNATTSPSG